MRTGILILDLWLFKTRPGEQESLLDGGPTGGDIGDSIAYYLDTLKGAFKEEEESSKEEEESMKEEEEKEEDVGETD